MPNAQQYQWWAADSRDFIAAKQRLTGGRGGQMTASNQAYSNQPSRAGNTGNRPANPNTSGSRVEAPSSRYQSFDKGIFNVRALAGYYFPHDEFYDTSMRDVIAEIGMYARPGARVASESPTLAGYYAERTNRPDLICLSLSDPQALKQLQEGDFIIAARGRRYFTNDTLLSKLHRARVADFRVAAGSVPSVEVYRIDRTLLEIVSESASHMPTPLPPRSPTDLRGVVSF